MLLWKCFASCEIIFEILVVCFYVIYFRSVNDFDENEIEKDKSIKGYNHVKSNTKWTNNQTRDNAVNCQRERRNKANREQNNSENTNSHKDEYCIR